MRATEVSRLSGSGITLISIVIGVVASTWPELFKPHPSALACVLLIGLALFIFPSFIKQNGVASVQSKAGVSIGNVSGRDNHGRQISAEVVHYHEAIDPEVAVAPRESYPLPPAKSRSPSISIGPIERQRLEVGDLNKWSLSREGKVGAVVWISNGLDDPDPISRSASLSVSLTFRSRGVLVANVNRTFWLDHIESETTLEFKTRRPVIIGICCGNAWYTYTNQLTRLNLARAFSVRRRQLESIKVVTPELVPFDEPLDVEVTVISSASEKAAAVANYRLSPAGAQMFESSSLL